MTKDKLKPCPFCGGEAELIRDGCVYGKYDEKLDYTPIIRMDIKATCKSRCDVSQTKGFRKTKEQAISAWNKRV